MNQPILVPLRAIDHCVLPVANLATARERHAALGFTVAPDGIHPFGTANACVHFADGSFLEPLAIASRELADAAMAEGNVFVARDRAWRAKHGGDGFSALVLRTDDASADRRRFVRSGVSVGPMLEFARASADLSGNVSQARFLLAFLAPQDEDSSFVFTCERVSAAAIDRSALTTHANGVTGIAKVVVASTAPQEIADLMAGLAKPDSVAVLDPAEAEGLCGAAIPPATMRFVAIQLATASVAATESLLKERGIGYTVSDTGAVHVPPAPGQGAHLIFEDA